MHIHVYIQQQFFIYLATLNCPKYAEIFLVILNIILSYKIITKKSNLETITEPCHLIQSINGLHLKTTIVKYSAEVNARVKQNALFSQWHLTMLLPAVSSHLYFLQ